MNDRPCLNCPDHKVGCHIDCKLDEAWQRAEKLRREKIYAAKNAEMILDNFRVDGIRKSIKRRRKK